MAIGALSRAVGVPMRRVVFSGGRDFGRVAKTGRKSYGTQLENSQSKIFQVLDNLGLDPVETTIVHGGARGADELVGQWAKSRGFNVRVYPANWDKHGKAAGSKRNWQMLLDEPADLVVSFPGGPGTKHMRGAANKHKVPLLVVDDKLAEAVSLRGTDAIVEAVAKKYAPRIAQAAAQPALPVQVPTGVSVALKKDFDSRIAGLRKIIDEPTTDPKYAESQYKTLMQWINRNKELTPEMLDDLRPLARELNARGTPQYSALRSFSDELDDLMASGMKRKDMVDEFKDLNLRLLEYVDTMGPAATGPVLSNITSRTLARFSGAAQDLGAVSARGLKIGPKAKGLKGKADELLEETVDLPAVKPKAVKVEGGVKDKLDDFVDEAFDADTIRDARNGIGIGRRTGPDGEVRWDLSPDDILQIASREEEAIRAGAGRFSKTEQQAIDKLNREMFSEEAAVDRFVDRDSPLSRAVEAAMGKTSSPDRFLDSAAYRAELARDLATGNYTVRKSRSIVRNPMGMLDEKGKRVDEIVIERVQKVRRLGGKYDAYEVFHTEVYHNGQKLTGAQLRRAFGSCPRCGMIYPSGTPGVCANPSCYSQRILRNVAKKTEEPARFVESVENFLGQGPLMTRIRTTLAQEPVERIVVVGDPKANLSNAEVSRFLELLDLPYDVKVVSPARGGVEDFVSKWFVNRNIQARSQAQQRIRQLERQGHNTAGMPRTVPDANVERMRLTTDIPITADRSYPTYAIPGGENTPGRMAARYAAYLPSGTTYGKNRTVLMAFGDSAEVKAVMQMAKKMRLQGDPVRIVNVGMPTSPSTDVLRELRPNADALRYLVNKLDVNAGNVSQILTGNEAVVAMRAQQELLRHYPGIVTNKVAGVWRGQAGAFNEFSRQQKLSRLYASRDKMLAALQSEGLPAKTERSIRRNLARNQQQIDKAEMFPIDMRRDFGEGIFLPQEPGLGQKKVLIDPRTREEMLARLRKNQDVSLKGRKLTPAEKADLKDFLEEIEKFAKAPRSVLKDSLSASTVRYQNPGMSDVQIIATRRPNWKTLADSLKLDEDDIRRLTLQFFKDRRG